MITNYAIYYSYKTIGDVLLVVVRDENVDKIVSFDNLTALYSKNEIVGYNIHNLSKIIKIHSHGRIFSPPSLIIDIINNILRKYELPLLDRDNGSKFIIGKVTSNNTINLKDRIINIDTSSVAINDVVVIAYPNSILGNGKLINSYKLCTYKDLLINENDEIIKFDDDSLIGNYFFSWEGNNND